MGEKNEPYRIRRAVYEQFTQAEPLKKKLCDIAVELGLWEIVE